MRVICIIRRKIKIKFNSKEIDRILKKSLGFTYGGPSIIYECDRFVLYRWFDAPVGNKISFRANTFEELLEMMKGQE